MPRKKKTPGTSNEVVPVKPDEGLEKLKVIKETLPPPLPVIDLDKPEGAPLAAAPEPAKKSISGIFRSIYPLIVDILCHVLNKEKFTEARKEELLESVSQDLDELERRYIPETVSNQPGVKALSITGIAIAFQPKAKKEPKKEPEEPQPEPEKKPEPQPAAAAPSPIPAGPQPGSPALERELERERRNAQ